MKRNDYLLLGILILTVLGFISQPVTALNCEKNFIAHLDGDVTGISTDAHAVIKLQFIKNGGDYSKLRYFINVANIEGVWEAYIYQKTNDKDWDPGNWTELAKLYEHNGGSDDVSGSLIKADNDHPDFNLTGVSSIAELQSTVRDFVTYAVITTSDYKTGEIASDFRCGKEAYLFIDKKTNGVDSELAPYLEIPYGEDVEWTYYVTNIGGKAIPASQFNVSDDKIGELGDPIEKGDPDNNIDEFETWVYNYSGTAECGLYTNIATVSFDGTQSTDISHYFGVCEDEAIITACKEQYPDTPKAGWKMILEGPDSFSEEAYTLEETGCVDFAVTQEGLYTLTEEDMSGWTRVLPPLDQPGYQIDVAIPGTYGPYMFVNYEGTPTFATINACKQEFPDSIVPDWMMYLDGPGAYDQTNTTDETGCAVFSAVSPGTYTLSEEERNGWTRLQPPDENAYTIDITGTNEYYFTFVNFEGTPDYATIPACKQDEKENPLSGWEMNLQGPGDYCLSQTTGEEGGCTEFSVPAITEGVTYSLNETQQPGWVLISDPAYEIFVDEPITFDPFIFRNTQKIVKPSTIRVWKYDLGENPVNGWKFTLNGMTESTGPEGYVDFEVSAPGTYTVTEEMKPSWVNVSPTSQEVTVIPDGFHDVYFVNFEGAKVTVCKQDQFENAVEGWHVYVDEIEQITGEDGCTVFYIEKPDTYTITEESRAGWTPVGETSYEVKVKPGEEYGPFNFTNRFEGAVLVNAEKYVSADGIDWYQSLEIPYDDDVYWKIMIENRGTVPVDITVNDTLNGTKITPSCSQGSIPTSLEAGENETCIIGPQSADAGIITNVVEVKGCNDGVCDTDTASAFYEGTIDADINVEKYVSEDGTDWYPSIAVPAETPIFWKIFIENTGTHTLDIEVEDYLDGSLFDTGCTFPDYLAQGENATCTIGPDQAEVGIHENYVEVTGCYDEICDTDNDTAEYEGTVTADLVVEKYVSVDKQNWYSNLKQVPAGSDIAWKIFIENTGTHTLDIEVEDFLDASLFDTGCTFPENLTPGENTTCIFDDTAEEGSHENSVDVTGCYGDICESSDSRATYATSITPPPDVGVDVEKYVSTDRANWRSYISSVLVDTPIWWQFTIYNTGSDDLDILTIGDSLHGSPITLDCEEEIPEIIQAGESYTCTFKEPEYAMEGRQDNYVSVDACNGTTDEDSCDFDSDEAWYNGDITADIEVTKYVSHDNETWSDDWLFEIPVGGDVYWKIVIENGGTHPLNLTAGDRFRVYPGGAWEELELTCIPEVLKAGEETSCVLGPYPAERGHVTNQIDVTGCYESKSSGEFCDSDVDYADYHGEINADIEVTKYVSPDGKTWYHWYEPQLPVGSDVYWKIVIENTGEAPLDLEITDQLDGDEYVPVCDEGSLPTSLGGGESAYCIWNDTAELDYHWNTVDVEGCFGVYCDYDWHDHDMADYMGVYEPNATVNKDVSSDNVTWDNYIELPFMDTVYWRIEIENTAQGPIDIWQFTDTYKGETFTPTCLEGALPSRLGVGEDAVCTFTVTAEPPNEIISNRAFLEVCRPYGTCDDLESTARFKAYITAELAVNKQVSRDNETWSDEVDVPVGSDIFWKIEVENTGTHTLDITSFEHTYDGQPATTDCTVGGIPSTIDPTQKATCIINGTADYDSHTNHVSVKGCDQNYGTICDEKDARAEYTGTIDPELKVIKQVSPNGTDWFNVPISVPVDSDIYWKITIENTGTHTLDLDVNDTLDGDPFTLSCANFTEPLAPGNKTACIIGPDPAAAGSHVNSVRVDGCFDWDHPYCDTQVASSSYFGSGVPEVAIEVYKLIRENITGQDIFTGWGSSLNPEVGTDIEWGIAVINADSGPLNITKWTDDYNGTPLDLAIYCPEGYLINLTDSSNTTVSGLPDTLVTGYAYLCIIPDTAQEGRFVNNVTVEAEYMDQEVNGTGQAVYLGIVTGPDIWVMKGIRENISGQDLLDNWSPGFVTEVETPIEWAVFVKNIGSVPLTITNWTDDYNGTPLDLAIYCPEGYLINLTDSSNTTVSGLPDTLVTGYAYLCIIPDSAQEGLFINTVTVEAEYMGQEVNGTGQALYNTGGPSIDASLTISKTYQPGPYYPYDEVVWNITVTNNGPADAYGIIVTDNATGLLEGLVSWDLEVPDTTIVVVSPVNLNLMWAIPYLENGNSTVLEITTVFNTTGDKTNKASITESLTTDPDESDNNATATVTISEFEGAAIRVEKYIYGADADTKDLAVQLPVGTPVNYSFVVKNIGTLPLQNITLTDDRLGTIVSDIKNLGAGDEPLIFYREVAAESGLHGNNATVTARHGNDPVSDDDSAWYIGFVPGAITGTAFVDLNQNGILDPGETGIPDVEIELKVCTEANPFPFPFPLPNPFPFPLPNPFPFPLPNPFPFPLPSPNPFPFPSPNPFPFPFPLPDPTPVCTVIMNTTTDINGNYTFTNLPAETYTVSSDVPAGYLRTTDADIEATVVENEITIVNFGFMQPEFATITACKKDDLGNNLSGWKMILGDPAGTFTNGTTGEDGCTVFTVSESGTYTLSEDMQQGWVPVNTTSDPVIEIPVEVSEEGEEYNFTFINEQLPPDEPYATITACKQDELGNNLTQWVMTITNGTAKWSQATNDTTGCTVFSVNASGIWNVSEEMKGGWWNVTPTEMEIDVTVPGEGVEAYNPEPFVNSDQPPEFATITACKKDDLGNNLSGWKMILGDPAGTFTNGTTGEDGCTVFTVSESGTYTLSEDMQQGWVPVNTTSDPVIEIPVEVSEEGEEYNFTFINEQLPPDEPYATITACKQDDLGNNLTQWVMTITNGTAKWSQATNDTTGCTVFSVNASGIWTVSESRKDGWYNITPTETEIEVIIPVEGVTPYGQFTFRNSQLIPPKVEIDVEKYVSDSLTGPWHDADTLENLVPIRSDIYDDVWWNITVTNKGTIWVDLNVTDYIDMDQTKLFPLCEGFADPLAPGMSRTCINSTPVEKSLHSNYIAVNATNASYPEMSYTDTDIAFYLGADQEAGLFKIAFYDLPGLNFTENYYLTLISQLKNSLLFPDGEISLDNMTIPVETPLNWTYFAYNLGPSSLENVKITDDKLGDICTADSLNRGMLFCHRNGTVAQLGEHTNVGTMTADNFETTAQFTYTGVPPLVISKMVWGFGGISWFELLFQDESELDQISLAWLVFFMDNYMFMDDEPPGMPIPTGIKVNWTYAALNIGFTPLYDVEIRDDQLNRIVCSTNTLEPAMSSFDNIQSIYDIFADDGLVCFANDTSIEGQYENNGTVTAINSTEYSYTAYDLSHYNGTNYIGDFIEVEKTVSDNPDGPWVEDISVPVGSDVWWNVTIRNKWLLPYNLTLEDYLDDDENKPVTFSQWPDEPVPLPGYSNYTLISSTLAEQGEHFNNVTVHAEVPGLHDFDPSLRELIELIYGKILEGDVSDRANYIGTPKTTPTPRPPSGGGGATAGGVCDFYENGTLLTTADGKMQRTTTICAWDGIGKLIVSKNTLATDDEEAPLPWARILVLDEVPGAEEERYVFMGTAYETGPDYAAFNPTIELRMEYNTIDWRELSGKNLVIRYWNNETGTWEDIPTRVFETDEMVNARIDSLGIYGLFEQLPPATPPIIEPPIEPEPPLPAPYNNLWWIGLLLMGLVIIMTYGAYREGEE